MITVDHSNINGPNQFLIFTLGLYVVCVYRYQHFCANQAGVPDGVINVVTGYGSTVGAAISSHMDIDMVNQPFY